MTIKFSAICLSLLIGTADIVQAADDDWTLAVAVDKVVYQPSGKGEATVRIESSPAHSSKRIVRIRLEYGLDKHLKLPDVVIDPATTSAFKIPFTAPSGTGGCAIRVALMEDHRLLAEAEDVFVVGKNPFRLGQQASTGGDLAANKLALYAPVDGVWPTRWRKMKGTYLEINCLGPGEFCGLKTDWDQWVSMQGKFKRTKKVIRAFTSEANRLGIQVMMYNNATPSGSIGTEWARKHPEWLSYNYRGSLQAMMNVQDIEKTKSWHLTMQPDKIGGFHPLQLMLNDRRLIEFGCDQMLSAYDDLGLSGVRFDGHWIIGQSWTGLGFDMHGHRPTRGESLETVNARNTRYMKKYIKEAKQWVQQIDSAKSITIPQLKAWKILVQEFPGTGDHIPIEVIPEKSFHGKDILPEPENGKIVFPILTYARGEFGTSLVADNDALYGHAFLCTPTCIAGMKVLDGPRKDTPTMMPGRLRMTVRLKIADNSSPKKVCRLTGTFGEQFLTCDQFEKPGIYQSFKYEYNLKDGRSDAIALFYYGETDLYMDSVVVEQLTFTQDRDLFSKKKLRVDSLPARKGTSKKAHLARGLWHDYFGLDDALKRAGIESTEAWETMSMDFAVIAPGLPASMSELMRYDLVALLNFASNSLQPAHRRNLREYVHRGGTLFVGGGGLWVEGLAPTVTADIRTRSWQKCSPWK